MAHGTYRVTNTLFIFGAESPVGRHRTTGGLAILLAEVEIQTQRLWSVALTVLQTLCLFFVRKSPVGRHRITEGCMALTVLQTLFLFLVRSLPLEDTAQRRGNDGELLVSLVVCSCG